MYIRRKVYSITALEGELLEKSFSEGITQYLQKVADDAKDYEEVAGDNVSPAKGAMLKRFYKYIQENPGKSAAIGGTALATIGGGIALAKYLKNKKRKEAAKSEESKEKNFSEYLDEAYDMGYEYAQKEFGWFGDKLKGWADKLTDKAAKRDSKGRKQVDSTKGKYGGRVLVDTAKGHANVSAAEGTAAIARGMERAGNKINEAEDAVKAKVKDVRKKAENAKNKAVDAKNDLVKRGRDAYKSAEKKVKGAYESAEKKVRGAYNSVEKKVKDTGKSIKNTALESAASVAGKISKGAKNVSKSAKKFEKRALKARSYSERLEELKPYLGSVKTAEERLEKRTALKLQGQNVDNEKKENQ